MPSVLSLFPRRHHRSPCHLPCPPSRRHLAKHQRRPPTFPFLSFLPFSSSAHRHHPSSPALPLFSASSPHPTALSPPRHRRPSPPSLPHLHRRLLPPSWSIPLPPPLSLFFSTALPSPPRRPSVGDLGVRKNLHGFEARRPHPPSAPPFLPSTRRRPRPLPLSSMPPPWPPSPRPALLLPRPSAAAAFLPPPLMSSPPPYFSVAALPPHQRPQRPAPPPLLVSASVRCRRRGLEPEMGIG